MKGLSIKSDIKSFNSIHEVINKFLLLKSSVHTRRAYKNDITTLFIELKINTLEDLADYQFGALIMEIQLFIDKVKKIEVLESRQRVLNARTVNRKINALRSFFTYLVNVYNYPKNPIDNFNNLKVDHYSNTESLTRAEIIDLLAYAGKGYERSETKYRDYLIIIFLFSLALRREEVANLKWSDLDLSKQSANIYQKGATYKLLPLPLALCNKLTAFKEKYGDSFAYIFHPVQNNSHKNNEKPISPHYIFKMVRKIGKSVVPAKNITPHSLRKSFIELALANGDDLISVANATGHSTIEMIKYYDTRDRLKNNSIHSLSKLL